MKIRDKLFLGFGLYLLLAVILGFFSYREIHTISTRLALVETADDITNNILEIRHFEKNFLLLRDRKSLGELQNLLGKFKKTVDEIKAEIVHEIGGDNFNMMKAAITRYEKQIELIADLSKLQKQTETRIRDRGRIAERGLSVDELQALLVLRRYEKNIMLYKNQESHSVFMMTYEESPLTDHPDVQLYQAEVGILYRLYEVEKDTIEKMRVAARDIQAFTQNLSTQERSGIATTIKMSINLQIVALVLVVTAGIIINIKLATSIASPILDLERITKKIARGDFSESITVKGRDEIASLADSFNQMEDKLDETMTALDEIIKKLQEKQSQLVEAEKLASVGKLAAGIAHEINNPLTSVLTFSNLMLEQCPPDDPRYNRLKMMVKETDRARTIIRQLLNFGREIIVKPEWIDINRPVSEIVDSLSAQEAFKEIELRTDLPEGLPQVHVDPAQIGQVVLNMLLNAVHAITPPGRIEVATARAGGMIEIRFADTGRGIPPENLNKIFDPFFTTKAATKGTGLGLAVSYGIIKKHGGDIVVESVVGKGTKFTVRLPVYG